MLTHFVCYGIPNCSVYHRKWSRKIIKRRLHYPGRENQRVGSHVVISVNIYRPDFPAKQMNNLGAGGVVYPCTGCIQSYQRGRTKERNLVGCFASIMIEFILSVYIGLQIVGEQMSQHLWNGMINFNYTVYTLYIIRGSGFAGISDFYFLLREHYYLCMTRPDVLSRFYNMLQPNQYNPTVIVQYSKIPTSLRGIWSFDCRKSHCYICKCLYFGCIAFVTNMHAVREVIICGRDLIWDFERALSKVFWMLKLISISKHRYEINYSTAVSNITIPRKLNRLERRQQPRSIEWELDQLIWTGILPWRAMVQTLSRPRDTLNTTQGFPQQNKSNNRDIFWCICISIMN